MPSSWVSRRFMSKHTWQVMTDFKIVRKNQITWFPHYVIYEWIIKWTINEFVNVMKILSLSSWYRSYKKSMFRRQHQRWQITVVSRVGFVLSVSVFRVGVKGSEEWTGQRAKEASINESYGFWIQQCYPCLIWSQRFSVSTREFKMIK